MKRARVIFCVVVFLVTLPWTIPRVQEWGYSGPTEESVSREMKAKLSPGDSEERVREVLRQLDVAYTFEKFGNRDRYVGTVRSSKRSVPAPACLPGSMKCATRVEVDVDDHGRYLRCEVLDIGDYL